MRRDRLAENIEKTLKHLQDIWIIPGHYEIDGALLFTEIETDWITPDQEKEVFDRVVKIINAIYPDVKCEFDSYDLAGRSHYMKLVFS